MTVYSYTQVRKQLSALLEKVLTEGQIKFRGRDGRVFVIRPEPLPKTSPLEVRSISLPINKEDIFEAIRESRARH